VLTPVLLPIDDHDTTAPPRVIPFFPAPAAVPVTTLLLKGTRFHGALGFFAKLGRWRMIHCDSLNLLARLSLFASGRLGRRRCIRAV
jgi:hypothetical protein